MAEHEALRERLTREAARIANPTQPTMLRDRDALENLLARSAYATASLIFKLTPSHSSAVVTLDTQYRDGVIKILDELWSHHAEVKLRDEKR